MPRRPALPVLSIDVSEPLSRSCASGFRRGGWVHRRQEGSLPLFLHGSAHSDVCFVKAYPAETAEAFCDGHVAAFDFVGGVSKSILLPSSGSPSVRRIKLRSGRKQVYAPNCHA